jgi:hypothetical protein
MGMRAKLWSLSSLSVELGRNVRTVSRALETVPPDGRIGKHSGWRLQTALAALTVYERQSDQLTVRYSNGSRRTGQPLYSETMLADIQDAAVRVEQLISTLKETPDIETRRKILKREGPVYGALDAAFERQLEHDPDRTIHEPFVRQLLGRAFGELMDLCKLQVSNNNDGQVVRL